MSAKKKSINFAVIILIAAMVLMPFMIYSFNVGGTKDIIDDGIDSVFNTDDSIGLMVTLYDENGDAIGNPIKSSQHNNGLAIKDVASGKAVTSLKVELYVTPSWTSDSTLSSYELSGGRFGTKITNNAGTQMGPVTEAEPSFMHPTITNGQPSVVTGATFQLSALENANAYNTGETYHWIYYMVNPLKMTLHFANGDTIDASQTAPQMDWAFQKVSSASSTFTSFSVTFYKTVT